MRYLNCSLGTPDTPPEVQTGLIELAGRSGMISRALTSLSRKRGAISVFVCWKFSLVFLTPNQVGVGLKVGIVAV